MLINLCKSHFNFSGHELYHSAIPPEIFKRNKTIDLHAEIMTSDVVMNWLRLCMSPSYCFEDHEKFVARDIMFELFDWQISEICMENIYSYH